VNFEWHPPKAEGNLRKHGVSFGEARTVFDDPLQMHFPDDLHSFGERRYVCVGMSEQSRLLALVYTEPVPDTIRLISAREATDREREIYEAQSDFA
jgi:uncharacterized protein